MSQLCKDVFEYYEAKSNVVEIELKPPVEEKPIEEIKPVEEKPIEEAIPIDVTSFVKGVLENLEYAILIITVIFIILFVIYRYTR